MLSRQLFRSATCVILWGAASHALLAQSQPQPSSVSAWRTSFLQLCDVACSNLNSPTRKVPYYQDSYAVRALAVAFDVTGRRSYLDACTSWSDRMVDFQSKMTPSGAYYMNYGRKPSDDKGEWYVADSSSIGLGVLTTAIRCREAGDEQRYVRYLDSAKAFARLTMDNYVGPGGGITDGLWSQFDGPWWCSSGIFASLGLLLYAETGDEAYRKVALEAIDWLNQLEIPKAEHISFQDAAPTVLMYVFEAYATATPYLEPGSRRHEAAESQWRFALQWMARHQASRVPDTTWDYQSQWGSKLGGLPFHMYVYARHVPNQEVVATAADQELQYIGRLVSKPGDSSLSQLSVFALMSYAEKVRPGALYRTSR